METMDHVVLLNIAYVLVMMDILDIAKMTRDFAALQVMMVREDVHLTVRIAVAHNKLQHQL